MFDCMLTFENYPVSEVVSNGKWSMKIENPITTDKNNYPLTIIITLADQINFRFSYNTALLNEDQIKDIQKHFENVLLQVIDNGERKLGDIKIITLSEEQKILEEFSYSETEYPKNKSVTDLFEVQAAKTPDNIGLVFEGERMSLQGIE